MKILNKKIAEKKSSASWIKRQLADPYVLQAKKEGYRSRAVYKLIEIDERFNILKNGQTVIDLGAAPGSWSEYISKKFKKSKIFAIDLLDITPIENVEFYKGDFTSDSTLLWLEGKLKGNKAELIISDMAPNTIGHQKTDHLRQMTLLEYAFDFAKDNLKEGGAFLAKSFTGGTTNELLKEIKKLFKSVHHIKPNASRKDSVEMFILATGFKL